MTLGRPIPPLQLSQQERETLERLLRRPTSPFLGIIVFRFDYQSWDRRAFTAVISMQSPHLHRSTKLAAHWQMNLRT